MADASLVETVDLHKRYPESDALRGLTLHVPAGSIFGFLGRNGAGKTTTIKILLGMVRPSGGRATVFGLAADDPASSVAIRRRTAFVSDEKDLYDAMTVAEMIRFTAGFFPRIASIVAVPFTERPLERRLVRRDLAFEHDLGARGKGPARGPSGIPERRPDVMEPWFAPGLVVVLVFAFTRRGLTRCYAAAERRRTVAADL